MRRSKDSADREERGKKVLYSQINKFCYEQRQTSQQLSGRGHNYGFGYGRGRGDRATNRSDFGGATVSPTFANKTSIAFSLDLPKQPYSDLIQIFDSARCVMQTCAVELDFFRIISKQLVMIYNACPF
ncbi:unnamed protein product [Musa textilis]